MVRKRRKSVDQYVREQRRRRPAPAEAETADTPPAEPTPTNEEREQLILTNGLDCLRRIKGDQTYEDWCGVGTALLVITKQALDAIEVAEWNGDNKRLVKEFNRRWEEYETGVGSNHKPLSKQERSALRQLMSNPQIHAWRATLDTTLQRQLTHPNTVVNKWKRATQIPDRDEERRKKNKPADAALQERDHKIEQQEERIRELNEELEGAREPTTKIHKDDLLTIILSAIEEIDAASRLDDWRPSHWTASENKRAAKLLREVRANLTALEKLASPKEKLAKVKPDDVKVIKENGRVRLRKAKR